MTSIHEKDELNKLYESAQNFHKQQKYYEAEKTYKAALELTYSRTTSRFNEINALLLKLYAETKQMAKIQSSLNDKDLVAFFTSKAGAQHSSAIINTWLKEEFYTEGRKLALQLMPNLQWVEKPLEPVPYRYYGRGCGLRSRTASEWKPSFNLRIWSETCNANRKPEEAERLFDECIEAAAKTGNQHTEQYVLITSLAAIQCLQLEHFDKVNSYFEVAFAAGKDMAKPPYWELFSVTQKLLPKNLEMAARQYSKLLPFSQDKVCELTIKLDLATEFAKYNQVEKATQLVSEVDEDIRSAIKSSVVKKAYNEFLSDIPIAVANDERVLALLDKLVGFPKFAYYDENGQRDISDLTVLRTLQINAMRASNITHEQRLLKMELDLLIDVETKTLVRKVHIYKKLAQLEKCIATGNEGIAADYEEKARTLNKELKETRHCWMP